MRDERIRFEYGVKRFGWLRVLLGELRERFEMRRHPTFMPGYHCIASLARGVFQSLISKWGLIQHCWVARLVGHMPPIALVADVALGVELGRGELSSLRGTDCGRRLRGGPSAPSKRCGIGPSLSCVDQRGALCASTTWKRGRRPPRRTSEAIRSKARGAPCRRCTRAFDPAFLAEANQLARARANAEWSLATCARNAQPLLLRWRTRGSEPS